MNYLRSSIVLTAFSVSVFSFSSAHAQIISVSFDTDTAANQPNQYIAATSFGGVVSADNFNNIFASSSSTAYALNDNTGTLTAATVQAGAFGDTGVNNYQGNSGLNGSSTADQRLNGAGVYVSPGFTVSGLTLTGAYDVYVYTLADKAITFGLSDNGGTSSFYGTNNTNVFGSSPFTYTQATSTSQGSPTANADYVEFTGLTGSSFTISTTYQSGGNAAIDGFQIVPEATTPEPSTWALMLGGVALLVGLSRVRFSRQNS